MEPDSSEEKDTAAGPSVADDLTTSQRFVFYWLPVVLWAAFIFFLSSIPGLRTDLGVWDLILRKGAHMTEFAVLTFLFFRAYRSPGPARSQAPVGSLGNSLSAASARSLSGSLAAAFFFSFFYSVSDEFHQSFVDDRHGVWTDVLIDTVGIAGMILYLKRRTDK